MMVDPYGPDNSNYCVEVKGVNVGGQLCRADRHYLANQADFVRQRIRAARAADALAAAQKALKGL
jgi:hypothetical protein